MLLGLPAWPVKCSLMAYAADAITNGFNESLLGVNFNKHLMCWFHCKNAIDNKLSLKRDLDNRTVVVTQIVISLDLTRKKSHERNPERNVGPHGPAVNVKVFAKTPTLFKSD